MCILCERCGADLERPYAVEYTDVEYIRYRARVVPIRGGDLAVKEEGDNSEYLGTKESGEPACTSCGHTVGIPREERV